MRSSKNPFALPDLALPWHQQLVMRLYMGPFVASSSEYLKSRVMYEAYSRKIVELAAEIPYEQHAIPILVPAQVGLLDDTRYWSIAQTLEHLLKVDRLTKQIIVKLASGEPANILVTPAIVAPESKCEPEKIFTDYREFIPTMLDDMDEALRTSTSVLTEEHPIFGPFSAKQWYWSLATRTSLRYRQLKSIRRGLTMDPVAERRLSLLPKFPGV